jgi:hypothetical protein
MRELFGVDCHFFDATRDTRSDQHAFLLLTYHDAGNGNVFIALVFVPGYQFILMKLRLIRSFLLRLDHVNKNFLF